MNNNRNLADVVCRLGSESRLREPRALLEYDRFIPLERGTNYCGATADSTDGKREVGIDGERVASGGELRWQRPQVHERVLGSRNRIEP